jgi:putative flippase GtrA
MALAYAIVIMFQLIVSFIVCRQLVFDRNPTGNVWREFRLFVSGISVLRLCDWVVYNIFVYYLAWNFLAVQVLNICLFSVLKFLYSEWIFQAEKAEGS